MDLAEKVAVVTGGASGIGLGTARALARAGCDLVLADVNEARLPAARAEFEALGRRVLAVRCDVAVDADVERLRDVALGELGRVDVLFNNAGVVLRGALEQIEIEDWRWQLEINLLGIVRGIRAFLPQMIERGSGYIVNTGSLAGLIALTGEGAPYVASKFAVVGLTESLALYARPLGIGVSLLCPTIVDTNLGETGRTIAMTPERAVAETAVAAAVCGNVVLSPDRVGELVVEGIRAEQFFILCDPAYQALIERRAADPTAFLEARLAGESVW